MGRNQTLDRPRTATPDRARTATGFKDVGPTREPDFEQLSPREQAQLEAKALDRAGDIRAAFHRIQGEYGRLARLFMRGDVLLDDKAIMGQAARVSQELESLGRSLS